MKVDKPNTVDLIDSDLIDSDLIDFDPFVPDGSALDAARAFRDVVARRRTIRDFSPEPISQELIETLIEAATSAPSGANKQPWRFVCVSDPDLKRQIRLGAEEEEREFYERRATESWLADLAPLGTDADKGFLEVAPWLIVVFRLARGDDGGQVYYGTESVGLACGLLLTAAHHAGLATLTHTPSPMAFLGDILNRPKYEKPFLLIPVGYPAADAKVPRFATTRKPLADVMIVNNSK
ncbi:MAG: iodotyrosine deiodinase [Myxococcota bacterium]